MLRDRPYVIELTVCVRACVCVCVCVCVCALVFSWCGDATRHVLFFSTDMNVKSMYTKELSASMHIEPKAYYSFVST